MPGWNHPHWSSGDAALDEEHNKLHQMMASLFAVIRKDPGLDLSTEAARVLKDRLTLHFQMEEKSALRFDKESCAILAEDHARLMNLFERVCDAMKSGQKDTALSEMNHFVAEVNKHDVEVDIPLFRLMANPTALAR